MITIVTHAIAILVGAAGGWLGHKKFGATADKIVTDVRDAPKP